MRLAAVLGNGVGETLTLTFAADAEIMDFLIEKGFVGLNGASLTIDTVDRDHDCFTVNLIPETLRRTSLGKCQIGDSVNIEIDQMTRTIVSTIQRTLATRPLAAVVTA